jgi:hypothetical protein
MVFIQYDKTRSKDLLSQWHWLSVHLFTPKRVWESPWGCCHQHQSQRWILKCQLTLLSSSDPAFGQYQLLQISDVPALAWPESPSFGLNLGGFGLRKLWARPKAKSMALAWPGFGLSQGFWCICSNLHFLTFKPI